MPEKVLEYLNPRSGQFFIDCTLGGASCTIEIAKRVGETGKVLAIDLDAWAAGRDAIEVWDGTASTYLLAALVSDAPTNLQVPKWNTGGTITWEDDDSGGAPPA